MAQARKYLYKSFFHLKSNFRATVTHLEIFIAAAKDVLRFRKMASSVLCQKTLLGKHQSWHLVLRLVVEVCAKDWFGTSYTAKLVLVI